MRIFQYTRKLPQALRVSLAAILLVFAINSIADAAHHHDRDAAAPVAHHVCGYCATFANISDAPRHCISIATTTVISLATPDSRVDIVARRLLTNAQPRAPPFR